MVTSVLGNILMYLWRLIPANPILLRVVDSGGKRKRDLFIRCGYLGLLVFLVIFASANAGTELNQLAQASGQMFRQMSYLQLGLVALLAPIFTAGAITQEKDSQTYDILLCTPLTNGQIVLGSLLSRLFFVIALLVSGIPIFSITQIFGGVTIEAIGQSFMIAAATACITGALAMAIATFKVGTGRTIFSFYLFIVIFLVGGVMLDQLDFFKVLMVDPPTRQSIDSLTGKPLLSQTSWLTGLNPFLALTTIVGENYHPPDLGMLPENLRSWPIGWMLTNPAGFYTTIMFTLSLLMVMPSIILLRRMAQTSIPFKTWLLQVLRLSSGDRNRKPRGVWSNPIAWREAKTKASAARATILRYSFMVVGLLAAIVLATMHSSLKPLGSVYKQYTTDASFNAADRTITLYSAGDAVTYRWIAGRSKIYLPPLAGQMYKQEISPDKLDHRLAVANVSIGPNNSINTLDLFPIPRRIDSNLVRQFLLGAVMVEFAVILLIVTNAAASTVTREKEDGTLDLLLTTPITSRYYIWGKLRGLVAFVLPLIAVPVLSMVIFIVFDFFRMAFSRSGGDSRWTVFWESLLIVPAMLVIVCAFAAIVGMQMSLRCRTTVMAVMASIGIVCGACGFLGWCGYMSLDWGSSSNNLNLVFAGFSPFTLLTMLIDPYNYGGRAFEAGVRESDIAANRWVLFVSAWIAVGAYTFIVWTMYKSMVKNFDMTIRRQSR
jgi:ABC-type transport system involved in multi-copper enzyme maturation permease subunit